MDVKGKLKDWLHATGKEIAKAVGSHIKEKGVTYAKEQLGLGLDAEMHGKGLRIHLRISHTLYAIYRTYENSKNRKLF